MGSHQAGETGLVNKTTTPAALNFILGNTLSLKPSCRASIKDRVALMALPLWHQVSLGATPALDGVHPPIPSFRLYHRFGCVGCWTLPPQNCTTQDDRQQGPWAQTNADKILLGWTCCFPILDSLPQTHLAALCPSPQLPQLPQ